MKKRELLRGALRVTGDLVAAALWRLTFQPEPTAPLPRTPARASSWYETCQRTALRAQDLRTKGMRTRGPGHER
jgi:hypothetical protein